MSTSDDELDNILDDALDSFQVEAEKKANSTPAAPPTVSSATAPEATKSEKSDATTNKDEGAAMRSFLEALKSPLAEPGVGSATQEEEDMKLVEEFVRGLENLSVNEQPEQQGGQAGAENFIKSIMKDMLSKEVLMEPIEQIRDGLKNVVDDMPEGEERTRTRAQLNIASELCDEFEGDADMEKIIHLLAKLKDSGKLPSQVVADLPEDEGDRDTLDDLANCPMQ